MKIKRKLLYYINLFFLLLLPFNKKKYLMSNEEIIKCCCKEKKSLIRFGDGEYRLMYLKKNISYQNYSNELKLDLLTIFNKYTNNSNYIICLPPFFFQGICWFLKNDEKYTNCFSVPRFLWKINNKSNILYGNAFIFGKGNEKTYSKIWLNKDKIIMIHNDQKWCDFFNKKYNKKAIFIKTIESNSYSIMNDLMNKIKQIDKNKEYLILISSGPMSKVFAFKMSLEGFQVIDTGHCFDDPLV